RSLPSMIYNQIFHDLLLTIFFFSSRRRHTRCLSDWSSDVCSSDLGLVLWSPLKDRVLGGALKKAGKDRRTSDNTQHTIAKHREQIGRASCRERGEVEEVNGG